MGIVEVWEDFGSHFGIGGFYRNVMLADALPIYAAELIYSFE
jgi:hypothetical protein